MDVAQSRPSVQNMAICLIRVFASPRLAYRRYRRYIQQIDLEDLRLLAIPPYHHYMVSISVFITESRT